MDNMINLNLHISDVDDILDALEHYGFFLSDQNLTMAKGRAQVIYALYERIQKANKASKDNE